VINVVLPPLRERLDDLPMLVDHFVTACRTNLAKEKLMIAPDALRLLLTLPWDGNVRELENTIERAAILCNEVLSNQTTCSLNRWICPAPFHG
jgi:two-component system NtrC family response regulator